MRGTAHVFGDDINTDVIMPIDTHTNLSNVDETLRRLFEPIRPGFRDRVDAGDIIVAGENFGCGSGRENTAAAIERVGIGAVVAESFSRIFYRNAISIGLPVVTCPNVTHLVSEGETVQVDLEEGVVRNLETGDAAPAESLPAEIRAILHAGGWSAYLAGRDTLRK